MVSKKRVKRKSLGLKNRRNRNVMRSQTKSKKNKNRLGSKNKRRRSRNTKKRKGGAENTGEASITDIGNLDFCMSKNTLDECQKYYTVTDKKNNKKQQQMTLCQFNSIDNFINLFRTAITKGNIDLAKLRNFLFYLREKNEKKDGDNIDSMGEEDLVKEIKELIGKKTDVCTPFIDDIYFKDAYDSYKDPNDGTKYGFGDNYKQTVFNEIPASRKNKLANLNS